MAATKRRAVPQAKFQGPHSSNTDAEAREWLYHADDTHLSCRGQRHNFPKIRVNQELPKGVQIVGPYREGVYEIVQVCSDCGTKRRELTGPRGAYDASGHYRYSDYPEGYRTPKGSEISPRQVREETWRRGKEKFLAKATKPAPVATEPAIPESTPAAKPEAPAAVSVRERMDALQGNQVQESRRASRAPRGRKG